MSSTLSFLCVLLIAQQGVNGKQNFRNEKVISAQHVTRPLTIRGPLKYVANHHGTRMQTKEGGDWLLHNMPETGPVVTDAKHMSDKWTVKKDINVVPGKTVGDALKSGKSRISYGTGYMASDTCIGTACRSRRFLNKGK
jgi:hypothetical protein